MAAQVEDIGDADTGTVPRVSWYDIADEFFDLWEQGQHIVLLGKTGSGKTTLALQLLLERVERRDAYAVALGTKARDTTLRRTKWPILRAWPPTYKQLVTHHVIFWPPYSRPSLARQTNGAALLRFLDAIMEEGGWTMFVDEMAYLVETLSLRYVLDEFWNGARSSGISLIAGTQRPAWLARSAVSQGDWVICFRINDLDDRKRAGEILGDRSKYLAAIKTLRRNEFLLVETATDRAVITKLPAELVRRQAA